MGKRRGGQGFVIDTMTLTVSAGAVTPDCDKATQFNIDNNASFTINNASNPVDGYLVTFRIKNTHATNAITITLGAAFRFGSGVQLTDIQSIPALKKEYITCRYDASDSKMDVVGYSPAH